MLTLGPAEAEEQLRYAVSVGMHEGGAAADRPTATGIRSGRRRRSPPRFVEIESADGAFDLILFGNESADSGGFQVGDPRGPCAGPADGQRRQGLGDRRRRRARADARPTPAARRTSCRCRRWSASRKGSTCPATRR